MLALAGISHDATAIDYISISTLLNDSPGDGFTIAGVSSATGAWPVAPGSLVSAYGVNLAPSTETAASMPFPTTLGGIRLHVRDRGSAGDTLAPLLYVSPAQINYVMPSSNPLARISVERVGSPYAEEGIAVPITPVAPGLFSVGERLAAGNAVYITLFGQESTLVTSCDGPACQLVPIDVSGAPVYLSLYGTGFARASTADSSCTVAGQVLPATYAGPQRQFPGLDQVNVLLPRSFAGTGTMSIYCSFVSPNPFPASPPGPPVSTPPVKLSFR